MVLAAIYGNEMFSQSTIFKQEAETWLF